MMRQRKFVARYALAAATLSFAACSDQAGDLSCKSDFAKSERLAAQAVTDFISRLKNGLFQGSLQDGAKIISADRIAAIRREDVAYIGAGNGEANEGRIFDFRIRNIEELSIGMYVLDNCEVEPSWSIEQRN